MTDIQDPDDDDDSIESIVRREQLKWKSEAERVQFKGRTKADLYKEARKIMLMIEKVTASHKWDTVYYYLFLYLNICMKNNLHKGSKSDKEVMQVIENLGKLEKRVEVAKRGMLYQYKYHSEEEARELEARNQRELQLARERAVQAKSGAAAKPTESAVASTLTDGMTMAQMAAAMDALRLPGQATSKIPEAIVASKAPSVVGQVVAPPVDAPPPPYVPAKQQAHHGGMSSECSVPSSKVTTLVLKTVLGDGSCAFRAIAQGMHKGKLTNDQEKAKADELRQLVVNLLQQRGSEEMVGSGMTIEQVVLMKDNYPSYSGYCSAMARSEYAGETEFWLLAEELDIKIAIFMASDDDNGGLEHLITYGTAPGLPVCLYWQRGQSEMGNHYDCLLYDEP